MSQSKFLLYFGSMPAQYGPILRVAEIICHKHFLEGYVIVPEELSVPESYNSTMRSAVKDLLPDSTPLNVHFLKKHQSQGRRYTFKRNSLKALLLQLKPGYIWIHAEFWDEISHQILWHYRFRRQTKIVAYVQTNTAKRISLLSAKWPFLSRTKLINLLLWPRLDGVAACATKSMENARQIGLPAEVPVTVNYLPVFGPDDGANRAEPLPWKGHDSFTIGFAGALTEQKGWKVLLKAVEKLPENFKVFLAGDGDQRQELVAWLERPFLNGRACYGGFLSHDRLFATIPSFDVLVLPSITLPPSPEQFGCVLAEAMACGVPVIGSDSGAIPETIGDAGLIIPEGNASAIADAIIRISEDNELRQRFITLGLERYRTYYSCATYAKSIVKLLQIS